MNLKPFGIKCGKQRPPGTKRKLRLTCSCELTGWPRTRAVVLPSTASGDTVILDEAFDFSNAPSGEGYWREFDIIVSSGAVEDFLEGEVGGQGIYNMLPFQLAGTEAQEIEFFNFLAEASGCLIASIEDKKGNARIVGNVNDPAYVVSGATQSTGKKVGDVNGGTISLRADTGFASPIYDADTHGFDLVPNT